MYRGIMLVAFGSVSLIAMSTVANADDEIQLDGITVTFSKSAESAIDAPAGTTVIERGVLDEQFQATRTSEILRTIPGVSTSENGRDTAIAVNIRGLQDFGRVNVLVDGARQNFQRSGHNANGVFYLEPEMLGSVDVTRGPAATVYGSGAIGGVASFNTLNTDDLLRPGEWSAGRVRQTFSTNGEGMLTSATGAVKSQSGGVDILAQANRRTSNDYEDGDGIDVPNSGETNASYLVKSRFRPAEGHEITGTIIDYNADFIDQLGAVQRDTVTENNQYTLGYTFARPDTPLVDFSAKVYRVETGLEQTRLTNSFFEPAGSERSFNVVTEGFDIFNTSRFDFGSVKLAVTYGGDAFRDDVQTSDPRGNGDEFTPSGERTVAGAFVSSKLSFFDTFDLISAVRYDTYELEGGTTSLEGERVSPKVTGAYHVVTGVTLFATYAEGYRAPAVTETLIQGVHPPPAPFPLFPNPNLLPEVAHNVEGGVNLKFDGVFKPNDAFRAKAVVFQNKVDDYIDQVTRLDGSPPFGFSIQYQNVANATLDGVEFESAYDARLWFVGLNAARIRGENDNTGIGLLSVPADQITLTVGFRAFDEKFVAGARARFVDEQKRVPASAITAASEAYNVFDLFAQYEVNDKLTMNLNIDNVTDENYRQYLDAQNSPGLNARMGLTMRLGE